MGRWLRLCFLFSILKYRTIGWKINYRSLTDQCVKKGRVEMTVYHETEPRQQVVSVNQGLMNNWQSQFEYCDIIVHIGETNIRQNTLDVITDTLDTVTNTLNSGRYGINLQVMFWGWGWGGKLGVQEAPKISIYFSKDDSGIAWNLPKATYEGIAVEKGTFFSTTNATQTMGDTIRVTLGKNQAEINMIFSAYRAVDTNSCASNEIMCNNDNDNNDSNTTNSNNNNNGICVAKELENNNMHNCPLATGSIFSDAVDERRMKEITSSKTTSISAKETKNGTNRPIIGAIIVVAAVAVAMVPSLYWPL